MVHGWMMLGDVGDIVGVVMWWVMLAGGKNVELYNLDFKMQ